MSEDPYSFSDDEVAQSAQKPKLTLEEDHEMGSFSAVAPKESKWDRFKNRLSVDVDIEAESTATFSQFPKPVSVCCKPWISISKRARALLVVAVTIALLVGLIAAIVLPISFEGASTRTYYIAAERVEWNYTPFNWDFVRSAPLDPTNNPYATSSNSSIGSTYFKARYIGYTDETFTTPSEVSILDTHLGLLGPVIRAQVDDVIHVHFKNKLDFPVSIHPDGIRFEKAYEGINYGNEIPSTDPNFSQKNESDPNRGIVPPGGTFEYIWTVPEEAGPTSAEFSSVVWAYYSTVDPVADYNSGLIGPIVVTKKGSFDSDTHRPTDVGTEFFILPTIFDENKSHYLELNTLRIPDSENLDREDPNFVETNKKCTFNGFLYANIPDLVTLFTDRIRWYILGMDTVSHTLFWSGQTAITQTQERSSSIYANPGTEVTADMIPSGEGTWMIAGFGPEAVKGMTGLWKVIKE
eukprot:TRINITY_DN324_c0_g2_i2.p1 TRINITY_DN324_c0_g2~~TRINITY_DN324_c0_g2_i2.p1  ORF type:complete len:507 (+),score=208.25 TRINITY_DN324_c0_g2_i2:128-1522(+)